MSGKSEVKVVSRWFLKVLHERRFKQDILCLLNCISSVFYKSVVVPQLVVYNACNPTFNAINELSIQWSFLKKTGVSIDNFEFNFKGTLYRQALLLLVTKITGADF